MEEHLTAARVANAISQDSSFQGHYLLVEGKKDVKVFRRFLTGDDIRIRLTDGKYKQREVFSILKERNFVRKIGIRDADFIRVREKFDPTYPESIFLTDHHDSEVMMISVGALSDCLYIVSDEQKVANFEKECGKSIHSLTLDLLYNLGCLRLANKRYSLGLAFRPPNPDGNRIKFDKFINTKNWVHLGNDKMVRAVREYSNNKTDKIESETVILEKLDEVIKENLPSTELVNGHDVSQLLLMIFKDGLGSKNKLLQTPDCVEDLLISCFDFGKFCKTMLYSEIRRWEVANAATIF